jgi:hypothetical protein
MTTRRELFVLPVLLALPPLSLARQGSIVIGTYPIEQMRSIPHLTLPRVLLYDQAGKLIDKANWPSDLSGVRASAGDGFCCESDGPPQPEGAGPPPDCLAIVYGANINEHFQGLIDSAKRPLVRAQLPPHKFLIVDYYASWCSPCLASRKALEEFMASPKSHGYATLIVDFSALQG